MMDAHAGALSRLKGRAGNCNTHKSRSFMRGFPQLRNTSDDPPALAKQISTGASGVCFRFNNSVGIDFSSAKSVSWGAIIYRRQNKRGAGGIAPRELLQLPHSKLWL